MKDFYELFVWEFRNIYSAEKQIVEVLPAMIKSASSDKLKEVLREHLKETKGQVKRLLEISKDTGISLTGATSEGMTGLLKETRKLIHSNYDDDSKDSALINCAQRIEHYEIASYGTLKSFAKHHKLRKAESFFNESAHADGAVDKKLTELAEGTWFTSGINMEAHKRCAA